MKILSIQQPWARLIANGYKDIENRDWTTMYRGIVLIHASKKIDTEILHRLESQRQQQTMPDFWKHPWSMLPENSDFETGGIVGYATLKDVVTSSDSLWFCGKYGFVLTQRHTAPFIPLRGKLGLFDAPAEIEVHINAIRDTRAMKAEVQE